MTPFQALGGLGQGGYVYVTGVDGATLIGKGWPNTNALDPLFRGINTRIRQDAQLVQSLQGVFSAYAILDITAVAAPGLQLLTATINGVSQISAAVNLVNGDPTASAAAVVANINAYVAIPDYRAVSFGGTVYIISNVAGSGPNGDVFAFTVDVGVTATGEDVQGGQDNSALYDGLLGHRYFIDIGATDPAVLSGTEITTAVYASLRPGLPSVITAVPTGSKINVERTGADITVIVASGGASVVIDEIVNPDAVVGDIVRLHGTSAASSILVQTASGGTTNLYPSGGADFLSEGLEDTLVLQYGNDATTGLGWYSQGATKQPVDVADLRAASIPASPTGLTSIALVNGGLVSTVNPNTQSHDIRITGSGYVLAGNNTFTGTNAGTEIVGDTLTYYGNGATATYAGGAIIIAGKTVPESVAATGQWKAEVICTSVGPAVWFCKAIESDFSTTQFIDNAHILDGVIDLGVKGLAASATDALYPVNTINGTKLIDASIPAGKYGAASIALTDLDAAVQASLGSNIIVSKVTVATADVLQLNATPYQLIAAPGAGFAIEVLAVYGRIVFNTTAYNTNVTMQLLCGAGGQPLYQSALILTAAATRILGIPGVAPTSILTEYVVENTAINLYVTAGNPLAGDSDLELYLTYRIITL